MVEKYVLENGVRVVLERIPFVRSVALGIWVGTGSRYETSNVNGISHFIEHMLFKGTTTRSAKEIAETFDRIGGHMNAFTAREYTCYYAKVLDTHFDVALDVLSDMFFESVFDPVEMEKEKKVILEEISMYEDDPDDLVHDLILSSVYGKHPLGQTILGTETVLKGLTQQHIFDFLNQHYTPQNVVISVAGNVDDQVIHKIEEKFSKFHRKLHRQKESVPEYIGTPILRTKKELEQAHICLAFPGLPLGHPELYNLIVLNNIIGGSMSSRLFQKIREDLGLAYSVYSYHSAFLDSGVTVMYAATATNQLTKVIELMQQIIEQVRTDGITDTELENAKEQLKGSLMLSLESTNSRMSRLGKNELMLERHLTLDEVLHRIDCVNQATVRKISGEILQKPIGISLVSSLETIPTIQW